MGGIRAVGWSIHDLDTLGLEEIVARAAYMVSNLGRILEIV